MEKAEKPLDMYVKRKRGLTAFAGTMWLAAVGGLIALYFTAVLGNMENADKIDCVLVTVGIFVWAFVMLVIGVLCFRNLFCEFVVTADESGVNDYSGFVHAGHIDWSEIEKVSFEEGSKLSRALDAFNGEQRNCVRLVLKDVKKFAAKRSFIKRVAFFFFGYPALELPSVSIKSFCSTVKKQEIYALLSEMHAYYSTDNDVVENGELDG